MSVRAKANSVYFYLYNTGREDANPSLVFPNVNLTEDFSFSIWVFPQNNIPTAFYSHIGLDGSYFYIGHDGVNWFFASRQGTVNLDAQYFMPLTLNRWTMICITKAGTDFNFYYGVEDPDQPNPWTVPVFINQVYTWTTTLTFDLSYIALSSGGNMNLSCFKYWHFAMDLSQVRLQVQRWDANPNGGGAAPFWVSPLRTAGDLSNIANPYASMTWASGHAFTLVWPPDSLLSESDPQYMANSQSCPAWVYPIPTKKFPAPYSSVNPGTTPLVKTTYKAPEFWSFEDRGSVPTLDHQIQSITHYGYPFKGGNAPYAVDTWGLYKDETGVEISPNFGDPTNRFEQDTGVVIPSAGSPIKASTMYLWKFGGQFTYLPNTPTIPTGTSALGYILLYVTFIGYPTGIPALPAEDLAGLFVVTKGQLVDRYNRGTELKIPDPTIRTAYIGE